MEGHFCSPYGSSDAILLFSYSRSVRSSEAITILFNRAVCAAMGDKSQQNYTYKMLLVGETESGKTSLFDLLCDCKAWGINKAFVQFRQCTGDIKMCHMEVNMCELNVGVINTPEFGGWREKDRKHTESINDMLKIGDHINCVCLIINGHQSCMAVTFKYALTEITSILPKEVLKNIIVVFTNTADLLGLTFDTTSLQEYLGREIEPASIFCIDCKSSQEKSFDETAEVLMELWTHIKGFQPVHTSHFTVLYQKRQKIEKTILDLLKAYDNLKRLEKELKRAEEEIDAALGQKCLNANFQSTTTVARWITVRTSDHNTLCGYQDCYSNCHEHCSLSKSFDKEDFKSCGGVGGTYCSTCGHHYTLHYHGEVRWEKQEMERLLINKEMKKRFEEAKSKEERARIFRQRLEQEKAELKRKVKRLFEYLLQTKEEFQELSLNRRYAKLLENHLDMIKQSGTAGEATQKKIEKELNKKEGIRKMALS